MRLQFNRGYDIDNRYANVRRAIDNDKGKRFVKEYISRRRKRPNISGELATEDRIIVAPTGSFPSGQSRVSNPYKAT
tara:strand:+ start:367 stop:597 length:231 start_codon:yes stop_codon:yes gene_type:complete